MAPKITWGLTLLAVGCGGTSVISATRRPATVDPDAPPIRVIVTGGAAAADVATVVKEALSPTVGTTGCFLVWGDVATPPAAARRATLTIDGRDVVEGWIACGSISAAAGPAIAVWRGGHVVVERPGSAAREVRFGVSSDDRDSTARDLIPALEELSRSYTHVAWELP